MSEPIHVTLQGELSQKLHGMSYPISSIRIAKDMHMSDEKKPEWLTIGQAVDHPDCPVKSRTTLHNMIKRGDIPSDCLDSRPLGDGRTVTYIDANCLEDLPYRGHGERGHGKRND